MSNEQDVQYWRVRAWAADDRANRADRELAAVRALAEAAEARVNELLDRAHDAEAERDNQRTRAEEAEAKLAEMTARAEETYELYDETYDNYWTQWITAAKAEARAAAWWEAAKAYCRAFNDMNKYVADLTDDVVNLSDRAEAAEAERDAAVDHAIAAEARAEKAETDLQRTAADCLTARDNAEENHTRALAAEEETDELYRAYKALFRECRDETTRAGSWWEAAKTWCRAFNDLQGLVADLTDDLGNMGDRSDRAEAALADWKLSYDQAEAECDEWKSRALAAEAKLATTVDIKVSSGIVPPDVVRRAMGLPSTKPRRYRDRDGDDWTLQPDGEYQMAGCFASLPIDDLRVEYGPLTELTD